MEELQRHEIRDLLRELEEEGSVQESLPRELEELLQVLQSGHLHLGWWDAAQ